MASPEDEYGKRQTLGLTAEGQCDYLPNRKKDGFGTRGPPLPRRVGTDDTLLVDDLGRGGKVVGLERWD
jgi:hypothetical protein